MPGKITGSVGPDDLPNIITAVGPYKTAHIVGCLHHGDLLDGTMDFDLFQVYFGSSFDRKYAERLVVEAFEEDTGLKVGSGDDEDHEDEEEDKDQVGGGLERRTQRTMRGSRERLRIRRIRRTVRRRIKLTT